VGRVYLRAGGEGNPDYRVSRVPPASCVANDLHLEQVGVTTVNVGWWMLSIMKTKLFAFRLLAAVLGVAALPMTALALSRSIGRDIEFPKNYDAAKAEAIRKVIQNERFKFTDGLVSYWEPDYGTRLSFEGDATALTEFLAELRKLPGISTRIILYRGRNDEGRRDTAWQLDYSKAHPDRLTVYLNLNAAGMEFDKIAFPEWAGK
jgi:hypothetical protein